MIIFFTLGIVLGIVSVVFVVQNMMVITVSFFTWHITGSLALVLIASIVTGMLITLLILLPESIANYFKYESLLKENAQMKAQKVKEEVAASKEIPPSSTAPTAE